VPVRNVGPTDPLDAAASVARLDLGTVEILADGRVYPDGATRVSRLALRRRRARATLEGAATTARRRGRRVVVRGVTTMRRRVGITDRSSLLAHGRVGGILIRIWDGWRG